MGLERGTLVISGIFALFLLTAIFITNRNSEAPKVMTQYEENTELLAETFIDKFQELGLGKIEHSVLDLPGGKVVSFKLENSERLEHYLRNDPNIKVVDSFDNIVQLEYSAHGYERAFELHYPWEEQGTLTLIVHNMGNWR